MDEIIEFIIEVVIANICETDAERWPLVGALGSMAFMTIGFFVVAPWSFGINLLVFAGGVVAFIALLNWAQARFKRRRAAAAAAVNEPALNQNARADAS